MRSYFQKALLITCGVALLAAAPRARALTNSIPAVSPNYAYDVWIRTDAVADDGTSAPGYCNASLLDARTLVTAAHCFQYAVQLGSRAIQVTLGAYVYATRPDGTKVLAGYLPQAPLNLQGRFVFLPELQSRFNSDPSSAGSVSISPDEDIALAVLDKPIALPKGFVFAKPLLPSEFDAVRDAIQSFEPEALAVNPVAQCTTTDTKRIALLDSISWSSSGFFESHSSSQLEEGDSGAPLLVTYQGEQRLIGVVKGHGTELWWGWDAFAPAGQALCVLRQSAGLEAPGC